MKQLVCGTIGKGICQDHDGGRCVAVVEMMCFILHNLGLIKVFSHYGCSVMWKDWINCFKWWDLRLCFKIKVICPGFHPANITFQSDHQFPGIQHLHIWDPGVNAVHSGTSMTQHWQPLEKVLQEWYISRTWLLMKRIHYITIPAWFYLKGNVAASLFHVFKANISLHDSCWWSATGRSSCLCASACEPSLTIAGHRMQN